VNPHYDAILASLCTAVVLVLLLRVAYHRGREKGHAEVNDQVVAKIREVWVPAEPVHITAPDEVHAILRKAVHDLSTATNELDETLQKARLNNVPVL
jgi:hypothetical protein